MVKTALEALQALTVALVLAAGLVVMGSVALAWSFVPVGAQAGERFTAFAINMNRTGSSATATVDIAIKSWTPDAQRDRLLEAAKGSSSKALLSALQAGPVVGSIKTPDSVSYDLRYARQMPGPDGGRRIVLVTDRPIGFWELRDQSRSVDYPFMLIELRIDKDGNGEGKLSTATKIVVEESGVLILEDYEIQPVLLQKVRKL